MASRAPDSSGRSKKLEGDPEREGIAALPEVLSRLKLQILDSRATSIKEKLAENAKKLEACTSQLSTLANSRRDVGSMDQTENKNMLSMRTANALCKIHGSDLGYGEKENMNCQEELPSSVIVFGNSSSGKCTVRPIKLPFVEKIPPYTTWMFLDRNQKMAEDQSVVGRRQIYYDQQGSETLICSDSEGDAEPEEEKRDFSEGEDQILWKAIHDHGSDPEVFSVLRQFINATASEIEERYEVLHKRWQENQSKCSASSGDKEFERVFLEKTLTGALDSFDNLFCRRCLVFDCRPHGGSQNLILPSEKQPFSIESEDSRKPCSNGCYLWGGFAQDSHSSISEKQPASLPEKVVVPLSLTEGENRGRSATPAINLHVDIASELLTSNAGKRKNLEHYSSVQENSKILPHTGDKQKKKTKQDVVITDAENQQDLHHGSIWECYNNENHEKPKEKSSQSSSKMDISPSVIDANRDGTRGIEFERKGLTSEVSCSSDSCKRHPQSWKPIEKDLYMKGLEIFGKNSCLIARNLLSGLKTCKEIADYMFNDGISMLNRPLSSKLCSEIDVSDPDYMDQQQMPARTRIWRRRGRARKLKYTWKSAGHPSIRKRIADGKERCKQYVPCGCQQMCSKQCPCLENATCCEKYCGCSKSCKNRFRGCHCAKSQCRSRQCPCFAAGRECDPDVCRNCWVSCGDGSIDAPPPRGDGYQCGNMKLLLKQQQRILLGRSDVAGWGAFIKNPVNKNDYLGEYTGELISHKEADKRGKIYDRANSSFLFDLNDEFVLDAYRKGDKLKFANHSSNPNCYAKIMLVAGDHRVGIFAKEHIDASEELFYDYRYGPDQAPTWARKPEGSKRDDATSSNTRRAHKVA